MMAMALGGRWGRLEDEKSEAKAADDDAANSDASTVEASETQVIEPSEVRAESDPWND